MAHGFTDCSFGAATIAVDPDRPSDLYTKSDCTGVFKSTDFGQTFSQVSTTSSVSDDCGGGISIGDGNGIGPPPLYMGCFRNGAGNFARSSDGGVTWTWSTLTFNGQVLGFYAPVPDPYDSNHLIMAGHEFSILEESFDGGRTWLPISLLFPCNRR
jgi:hypothetical protein